LKLQLEHEDRPFFRKVCDYFAVHAITTRKIQENAWVFNFFWHGPLEEKAASAKGINCQEPKAKLALKIRTIQLSIEMRMRNKGVLDSFDRRNN
jgi:hypothetical protein